MPFTLSHAAAVLPAIRRTGEGRGPLIASALVAGSFAPDLPYYADSVVPGAMEFGEVTHGLPGVLTVDVALTAVLVAGWLLVREPLLALLPRAWQGRVYAVARGRPWRPRGPRQRAALAGWFFLCAVLGGATHVVWDAFTHPGRWGTRLVPVLNEPAGGRPVAAYLQSGTSALALAALGWFLWTALRHGRAGSDGPPAAVPALTGRQRSALSAWLVLCVLVGAAHRTLRAHAVYGGAVGWFDYVPSALFGAGAGLVVGLLGLGVAVRLLLRRTPGAAGRRGPI
ncbi:DUF4184 family protein [Streptomyces gilvosporeus]|uniref:DUF4184 domain-containing protein n=1 Tax=Streptomyces gilvosporeus TaxID=553510 RepID=A0A1V0TPU5_9ACTN|nr:DUF4184 family protein [Streptomyces gilvosporeus]ARF54818.1 hypothetical protein B1H19_11885 [Streptomyces gilvosporeus]